MVKSEVSNLQSSVRFCLPAFLNNEKKMDKERLKLIVRNLKSLVDALESEVHSDIDAYKYENYTEMTQQINDYDEVFDDDDGYPD